MTEPAAGSTRSGQRASVRLLAAVIITVVVVDQLTKAWAVSTLTTRTIHVVWTLQFHLAYNTGMAFGRGRGIGPIIGAFALLVVVGLLLTMRRGGGRVADVAVGLVVGGAIGNLLDRLFRGEGWLRGGVVDFIDFQWFPIFNVADMAITIGGAILLLNAYVTRPHPAASSTAGRGAGADADKPDAEGDDDDTVDSETASDVDARDGTEHVDDVKRTDDDADTQTTTDTTTGSRDHGGDSDAAVDDADAGVDAGVEAGSVTDE